MPRDREAVLTLPDPPVVPERGSDGARPPRPSSGLSSALYTGAFLGVESLAKSVPILSAGPIVPFSLSGAIV